MHVLTVCFKQLIQLCVLAAMETRNRNVCVAFRVCWQIGCLRLQAISTRSRDRQYIGVAAVCSHTSLFSKRSFDRLWQIVGSYRLVLLKSR